MKLFLSIYYMPGTVIGIFLWTKHKNCTLMVLRLLGRLIKRIFRKTQGRDLKSNQIVTYYPFWALTCAVDSCFSTSVEWSDLESVD